MAGVRYTGEIRVEGELHHVWVFAVDPRWRDIAKAEFMAEKLKDPGKKMPKPMTSNHAPGKGRWFRAQYADGFPLNSVERLQMAATADGFRAFQRKIDALAGR